MEFDITIMSFDADNPIYIASSAFESLCVIVNDEIFKFLDFPEKWKPNEYTFLFIVSSSIKNKSELVVNKKTQISKKSREVEKYVYFPNPGKKPYPLDKFIPLFFIALEDLLIMENISYQKSFFDAAVNRANTEIVSKKDSPEFQYDLSKDITLSEEEIQRILDEDD